MRSILLNQLLICDEVMPGVFEHFHGYHSCFQLWKRAAMNNYFLLFYVSLTFSFCLFFRIFISMFLYMLIFLHQPPGGNLNKRTQKRWMNLPNGECNMTKNLRKTGSCKTNSQRYCQIFVCSYAPQTLPQCSSENFLYRLRPHQLVQPGVLSCCKRQSFFSLYHIMPFNPVPPFNFQLCFLSIPYVHTPFNHYIASG